MKVSEELKTQFLDESPSYSGEAIERIKQGPIPKHIAIIPDGNRRWSLEGHASSTSGHREGADSVTRIVKAAKELGVEIITIYGFSTENWSRSQEEVEILLRLIAFNLRHQCPSMVHFGVKLEVIGDISAFPPFLQEAIEETLAATAHCTEITLVFALNYGGRDDLARATRKIATEVQSGELAPDDINEHLISQYLDTHAWPDPDLFIRTSGEMRVSNFLLWQISYSEIYVTDVLWPDFSPQHLLDIVVEYQGRERRWGGRDTGK